MCNQMFQNQKLPIQKSGVYFYFIEYGNTKTCEEIGDSSKAKSD